MASKILDAVGVPAFDVAQRFIVRRSDDRAEALGERFGMLAFRVDKKHRQRTVQNLELAFPEWSDAQRQETAKNVFRHFGRMWVQFMRNGSRSKETIQAATTVVGLEHLLAAESEGKGILFVTGHFGNWEWIGQWLVATGRKLTVVQRDANQSGINDRLTRLREAGGLEVMSRGAAARGILACLRRKESVGLLIDQNAGDVFVPFFGKPAGTVTGPAVIGGRTGAPIVPGYAIRLGPGRYQVEFLPKIDEPEGDDQVERVTAAINANLEAMVRRYPDQWLWMHDRWKSARQAGML
ncbi:MAG TPA: lysophospholipid acyltransferase family protein [Fimbriimonadaceae bacterium]|nr:lysophospholipid acyltransferase family protein [Fimbriimonadaceae bacterium]